MPLTYPDEMKQCNIAVGENAGSMMLGEKNIVVGKNAGKSITTESNCIIIGDDMDVDDSKRDGQIVIAEDLLKNGYWESLKRRGVLYAAEEKRYLAT